MKIKIISFILFAATLTAGCQKSNIGILAEPMDKIKGYLQETEEDKNLLDTAQETEKTDSMTISDELYDFNFILDGEIYDLPFAYSQITEAGWKPVELEEETKMVSSNAHEIILLEKNGCNIYAYVTNPSGTLKELKECKIDGIKMSREELADQGVFTMAEGIAFGAAEEDITEAFGKADYTVDHGDSIYISYEDSDSLGNASFHVSKENGIVSIELKNFKRDENDTTDTSLTMPGYLASYQTPETLGYDLFSGIVQIENDLYGLPAPVRTFTDNGWDITFETSDGVGAGEEITIVLEKDGKELPVGVTNFGTYQTIIENCAVSSISVQSKEGVSVRFPNGISFDTTKAELDALYPDIFTILDSGYTYNYNDFSKGNKLTLTFSEDTNQIGYIYIGREQWLK